MSLVMSTTIRQDSLPHLVIRFPFLKNKRWPGKSSRGSSSSYDISGRRRGRGSRGSRRTSRTMESLPRTAETRKFRYPFSRNRLFVSPHNRYRDVGKTPLTVPPLHPEGRGGSYTRRGVMGPDSSPPLLLDHKKIS